MHGTAGYSQDGAQVARQRPREVPRSSNDPPPVTAAQDGAKKGEPSAWHVHGDLHEQSFGARVGMVRAILDEIDGELVPRGLGGVIGVRWFPRRGWKRQTPMAEAQSVAGCGHAASGVARTAAVEPWWADDRDGGAKSGGRHRVDG
uniref:Uncharacterized protein n=1 Tax=Oryza barthii TaxID=65489 RepID=A0A0D3FKM6_9ORYZ